MTINDLTHKIIGCAMDIHRTLGPGLLENVYHRCMEYELTKHGISCRSEVFMPVQYETLLIENGYKADLIVDNQVILEFKSIEKITDLHKSQLLTYLKLSGLPLGLLINFREPMLKNGLYRLINDITKTSVTSADSLRPLRDASPLPANLEGPTHA